MNFDLDKEIVPIIVYITFFLLFIIALCLICKKIRGRKKADHDQELNDIVQQRFSQSLSKKTTPSPTTKSPTSTLEPKDPSLSSHVPPGIGPQFDDATNQSSGIDNPTITSSDTTGGNPSTTRENSQTTGGNPPTTLRSTITEADIA